MHREQMGKASLGRKKSSLLENGRKGISSRGIAFQAFLGQGRSWPF